MIPRKDIQGADGTRTISDTDSDSGIGFIIAAKGGMTRLVLYFEDQQIASIQVSAAGALNLSDALKKAAYHGK